MQKEANEQTHHLMVSDQRSPWTKSLDKGVKSCTGDMNSYLSYRQADTK